MSKLVSQLRALAGMSKSKSKHRDILRHAANEIERLTFLVTILIPGPGNRPTQGSTMKQHLCVGDEFYAVLEDLCYQPSIGGYAKRVRWGQGTRVAVSKSIRGPWRFWTKADAVQLAPPRPVPPRSGR